MALRLFLPLNGNLNNQGLDDVTIIAANLSYSTNGKIGSCANFNNTGYIRVTPSPFSNSTNDWSFACWMNVNASHNGCLFSDRTGVNSTGITIFYCSSQWIMDDGARWQFTPKTTIQPNVWYHVCFVRKGGVGKYLYINGALDSSTTTSIGTQSGVSSDYCYFGQSGSSQFNGLLNDIRLYDHALSPLEVKRLSEGLIVHHPLTFPGNDNKLAIQISDRYWTNWHANVTWASDNTREKIEIDGKTWAHVIQHDATGYGGYACDPAYNKIVLDPSKRYTWSCIAKGGSEENAEIILWCHWRSTEGGYNLSQSSKKFQLTSTPQRISWTLPVYTHATYTVNRINLMMGTQGTANNEIYFTDVKFEEGEESTPWLPNSTDPLYVAMGYDDTTEYDVSGFCNNGTKIGTITPSSDTPRYRMSYYFDSSVGSCVQLSDISYENMDYGTISFWMKPVTFNNWMHYLFIANSFNWNAQGSDFIIIAMDGQISSAANKTNVQLDCCSYKKIYSMTVGNWYHVAITWDAVNYEIKKYVNGVLVDTVDDSTNKRMDTYRFRHTYKRLGGNTTAYSPDCNFSDFRIYTTALSASDILALYNTPISLSNNGTLLTQGEYVEV